MKEMLLIKVSPEELKEIINTAVKEALKEIKHELQHEKPEELITRKEAAKILKISLPTLHLWSKQGKIKRYRKGNKVYYKRNEIYESFDYPKTQIKRRR